MPNRAQSHPNANAFPKGLSGPALRALANANIRSLADVAKWSEKDLAVLHGMGPKGITILKAALNQQGRTFRESHETP